MATVNDMRELEKKLDLEEEQQILEAEALEEHEEEKIDIKILQQSP